ncbi:DUF5695 domain-containing protein [Streptomyces viridochromogenes]|uniref:DUF5695 domain-containing protein n=1 Tax=Streptomyces viridochromogenes TaxID=1938 RepID=UPI000ABCA063|nr:DUF5695 domain-containing protein [Streptomyces viridochromogenes]
MVSLSKPRLAIAAPAAVLAVVSFTIVPPTKAHAATTYPYTLSSRQLHVGFASDGSIQSLKVAGDTFDTEYVMNPDVAPDQGKEPNPKYRQWLGNVMFSYATGAGTVSKQGVGSNPWKSAWTTSSADSRTVAQSADGKTITVTYKPSTDSNAIKKFTFTETYSLAADGSLTWKQKVTNTSGQRLVIGDWGVPLPDNELWKGGDEIYETRVLSHSYVGKNSSYVTIGRPSGQGPSLLFTPDTTTGSGFEYQDRWRTEEVGDTPWAWNQNNEGSNVKGLNVYYVHSKAIQKTNRGYLPSTSLSLARGASKTYAFHIGKVNSDQDVKDSLYRQGLLDTTVVPGLVVPYDQTAQVALRVKGAIKSIVAKSENDSKNSSPTDPRVTFSRTNGQYRIYKVRFGPSQIGNNQLTVHYTDSGGRPRTSVLQFDVIGKISDLVDSHAKFMVDKTQWNASDGITTDDIRYKTFDDWLMNAKDGSVPTGSKPPAGRRDAYDGYWGLGDDWGLTHAQFLSAKLVARPDATQVKSLDDYLEKAVWEHLLGNTAHQKNPSYLVYDFWEQGHPGSQNTSPAYRGYAYPHVYNTYFGMYRIAKQNPGLITYAHSADWYLSTAYHIFKELYDGPVYYNWDTGLMGELTTPALISALRAEGMDDYANDVEAKMATKYANFSAQKYPYGSEYSYDNTGEEAVYTLARQNVDSDRDNALRMMRDIVLKTRATRGQMPVWYWYANPTTNTGENWWQFQYTVALAGYTMDDYINHTSALESGSHAVSSADRAVLQRLNYAAKTAAFSTVNSGQISNHPDNIGASAWTYQSEKGNLGTSGVGGGPDVQLLNGWRGMTGESDLGLWGALQTLSADVVTDDPVFGTVGYGATVTSGPHSTHVIPRDGLGRRLNLVTQRLSVSLDNDRYTAADVNSAGSDVDLTFKNVSGAAHSASLQVTGLAQGTYAVKVDGRTQRKVNVYTAPADASNLKAPTSIVYDAPAGTAYKVHLVPTTPDANTAPTVDAGGDQTGIRHGVDTIQLSGTASDDGLGSPNGTLTTTWSVDSKPAGSTVRFSDASGLHPTVTEDKPGTYAFRLTVSDGEFSRHDTVRVVVDKVPPMPANWVKYSFDSSSDGTVADLSGNKNTLTLKGNAVTGTDGGDTVLKLDGGNGTYAQLPDDILAGGTDLTISMRAKVNRLTDWTSLLDIGSSTQKYLRLTPKAEHGSVGVGITTTGGSNESEITTDYTLPTGKWVTLKLTFKDNGNETTTGTLYANGTQLGQNTAMTVSPHDLGRTTGNYLGKSQYADPHLDGEIDDFEIHGDIE